MMLKDRFASGRFLQTASRESWHGKMGPRERVGVVRPARLERATHCLEGSCSIHLSYERIYLINRNL